VSRADGEDRWLLLKAALLVLLCLTGFGLGWRR